MRRSGEGARKGKFWPGPRHRPGCSASPNSPVAAFGTLPPDAAANQLRAWLLGLSATSGWNPAQTTGWNPAQTTS